MKRKLKEVKKMVMLKVVIGNGGGVMVVRVNMLVMEKNKKKWW